MTYKDVNFLFLLYFLTLVLILGMEQNDLYGGDASVNTPEPVIGDGK
jgi:hypothetical protein